MAADVERGQRIRGLKEERPDLTWARIADAAGVTERVLYAWAKNGGLTYAHAQKLAEFFEVDLDWLWRGPHETPDLMGALSVNERLRRLEAKVDELLGRRLERALDEGDEPEAPPAAGT